MNASLAESPVRISADIDPITFSVVLGRLNSIAEEMTHALENAAFSSIISLARDYSCGIYDAKARQIAMQDGLPIHTNSIHLVLQQMTDFFDEEVFEGDVIVCNDPRNGNTHIGDLVTAHPVFFEGEHVFWAVARGHQMDTGAAVPTTTHAGAENRFQEGIYIPPVKMYEKGEQRRDAVEWYLNNVRWPETLRGDLMAQFGSIWTGGRRLVELCERYGRTQLLRYIQEALTYAERRTRAEIKRMPNGVYEAEGWFDTDGGPAVDQRIKVKVTIHDETVDVDFEGTDPAGAYGMNGTEATTMAAGGIPVVMSIDPDIPHNEGCLRLVNIDAPEGSLCKAPPTSATALATVNPSDLIQDVVAKALAKAIPDAARAGGVHFSNILMLSGIDERDGTYWGHIAANGSGGTGAARNADGWPVMGTLAGWGALKFQSIEYTELLHPLRIEECEMEPESMGLGEYIGGPGVRCKIRPLHGDVDFLYSSDGLTNPPYGVGGGTPGAGGGAYIESDGEERRRFMHSAFSPFKLRMGEAWVGFSTGGGGCGNPLDRPAARVANDVREGFYSEGTARDVFGVVLDSSLEIDDSATEAARVELRGTPVAEDSIVPDVPRASSWFEDEMEEGDVFISPFGAETAAPTPGSSDCWSKAGQPL